MDPTGRATSLLQIAPGGVITPIATNADGLLGAANRTVIHVGKTTVIYLANTGSPLFSTNTPASGRRCSDHHQLNHAAPRAPRGPSAGIKSASAASATPRTRPR